MNKRDFILAGGSVLVGGSAVAAMVPGPTSHVPASPHGLAAWQQRIGAGFAVLGQPPDRALVLENIAVRASGAGTEQFTLVFSGSAALAPGSRLLRGDDGRVLPLYLDSAGRDAGGTALLRADCAQMV